MCEDVVLSLISWTLVSNMLADGWLRVWTVGERVFIFSAVFFPPPPQRDRERATGHLSATNSELLTSGCLHRGWPQRFAIRHVQARRAGACGHRRISVERSEPATTQIKIKMKLCASVYLLQFQKVEQRCPRCFPLGGGTSSNNCSQTTNDQKYCDQIYSFTYKWGLPVLIKLMSHVNGRSKHLLPLLSFTIPNNQ